jgi:Bacterial membrane protein YfhO
VTPGSHDITARAGRTAGGWLTPWRFAAILALFLATTFPQVVAGLEAFVRLDAARFGYPVAFYYREAFWRGELPLWNPLNSCGLPFLAQWNTLTLYPLSLFYLLLPMPWSFGVFDLGHLVLAGVGMYCLAWRWVGNRLGAALAGAAFAFNGFTWQALMWPNIIAAWGWMPWVVLGMERGWREGGRWVIVAAVVGALQMLSGGAEVILLTWLVIGGLWLMLMVAGEVPRIKLVGRALGTGCLVAGLSAAQTLPFLDLLAHSQRNVNFADSGDVVMPAWGWANYLVPLFHGFRTTQGIYLQPTQNWTPSYYVGIGIVGLALLAVWRVRNRRVWVLTGIVLFSLIMALGSQAYVYDVVRRLVPPLGLLRFPIKFVMLATFALPPLAAYGLHWLWSMSAKAATQGWRAAAWLALGLLAAVGLILFLACTHPLEGDHPSATVSNGLERALFLVLVAACLVLITRLASPKLGRVLELGLIALVWLDVFTHMPDLNPTAPCAALAPDIIRRFFNWGDQFQPGTSRVLQSRNSFWTMATRLADDQQSDLNGRRLSMFADLNLLDHVAKFDGFFPLDLKEFAQVLERVCFTTNNTARLQDFVGISLTGNPTNAVDWVRRDTFLPLLTAGQKPAFADPASTLTAVGSARFAPEREVYLPVAAQDLVQATNAVNASVISSQFTSQRLEMEVEAAAPAMVVIAQAFYHPWHAYVDGKPTPLWRANYTFQALEVPAGKHQVRVVYEDSMFIYGCVISLVCVLGCAAASILPTTL